MRSKSSRKRSSASIKFRTISSAAGSGIAAPLVPYPTLGLLSIKEAARGLVPEDRKCGRFTSLVHAPLARACGRNQGSGFHFDHGRGGLDLAEKRRIRTGHPRLRAELGEFAMQRQPAHGIEMCQNLVEH